MVIPPGTCEYDARQQVYKLTSAGANIWGDHDDFHFVWRRMPGNFIVTMRAEFLGAGVNPHRKLGWMARTSLDTSSPDVSTGIHGDGLVSLQFRRTQDGQTEEVRARHRGRRDPAGAQRQYLYYVGCTFRRAVYHGAGEDIDLGDEVYVGLFVCSHEDDVVEKAIFHDVRIVVPVKAGFDRERDPFGSQLEILDVASGHRQIIYSTETSSKPPTGRTTARP